MENLSDSEDIHGDLENTEENIKTSATERVGLCELKQHNPWFPKEYLRF